MSVITMPTTLAIGAFSMEQVSYDMMESSDATGSEAVRLFGPPRWRVGLAAMSDMNLSQAADWEVIQLTLRRGVNCLGVWDPVRIVPQGTLRGSNTLSSSVVAGATTMPITGATGTLKKGDPLQIGTGVGTSQLVKVMADMTAPGTVTFEPALRIGFSSGTGVTWDRPVFYARSVGKSVKFEYQAGNLLQNGFAFDLLETFTA